jgi:hypothetical protein
MHYERYPVVYRLLDVDCDWSFLDPIASELEASWTDVGPGQPSFRVTGSVQSIMDNRDLMLGLAQVHYRKNILRMRFEIMAAERESLMLRAEQLLAEGL